MSEVIYAVVKQMADRYSHAGISISPKPNTALAPIVQEIIAPVEKELGKHQNASELVNAVNDNFDDGDNVFDYNEDGVMVGVAVEALKEQAFSELVPVVKGLIQKTKTVVIPAVSSIVDRAYADVADNINSGSLKLNMLSDDSDHPLWRSEYLLNTLFNAVTNQTTSNENNTISALVSFKGFDDTRLDEIIKTGDEYTDGLIEDYLAKFNRKEALEYSYHTTFRVGSPNRHTLQCPRLHAFLSLLMAYRFVEDTPDGITGSSLDVYEFEMTKVINYWASSVKFSIDNDKYYTDKGIFVRQYQVVGSEFGGKADIIVNGQLLDVFDERVGNIEVLYGASISDQPTTITELAEKAERYCQRWANYYKVCQSEQNDKFQDLFCSAVTKHIRAFASEFEYKIDEKEIDNMFKHLSFTSLNEDNSYTYARKFIVKSLFQDDNINKLLNNADAFLEADSTEESIDVALEIALLDLLAEWAIDQMIIKG